MTEICRATEPAKASLGSRSGELSTAVPKNNIARGSPMMPLGALIEQFAQPARMHDVRKGVANQNPVKVP